MIDHISLRVSDFEKARAFYVAALEPLGYEVLMEFTGYCGMGVAGKPDLWITQTQSPVNQTHLAFRATRPQIHAFYEAALAAGGTDSGAPGPRLHYHPNYYGAFVLDPDGNVIEAVSHLPEGAEGAVKKAARKPAVKKATKKPAVKKATKKPAVKKATKKPVKKATKKPVKKATKKPAKRR